MRVFILILSVFVLTGCASMPSVSSTSGGYIYPKPPVEKQLATTQDGKPYSALLSIHDTQRALDYACMNIGAPITGPHAAACVVSYGGKATPEMHVLNFCMKNYAKMKYNPLCHEQGHLDDHYNGREITHENFSRDNPPND